MTLVKDAGAMADTLRRLHAQNESVIFYNDTQTLKLVLRNDPIDANTMACELAVAVEEGEEKVLDFVTDGYVEDPTTWVLESWSFPMEHFGEEDATKVTDAVNRAYLYRMCGCQQYVIKDDSVLCLFCHMTSTADDTRMHFCPICCEEGVVKHMAGLPCCQQKIHQHCLKTWKAKSGDQRCPLCRQP